MTTLVASLSFLLFPLLLSTTNAGPTKTIPTTLSPSTRLPLIDLSNLSSSEDRLRRDAARMAALVNQLSDDDIQFVSVGGGVAVNISIGTPPVVQTLVADTGSDLMWVQCKKCDECIDQPNLKFDPDASTSYQSVPCASSSSDYPNDCDKLRESARGCDSNGKCTYHYNYGDNSYSKGTLALETLTIGNRVVQDMPFGCGLSNNLTAATEVDGILGLGDALYSVVGKSGGAFSYCLSEMNGGWIVFDRSDFPSKGVTWVPRVSNPMKPMFYYVRLMGIGVDGVRLPGVTADMFLISDDGNGGAIIDTGTTITRLPNDAYVALRDEFRRKMGNAMPLSYQYLDTCYQLSGLEKIPTVSLYLSDQSDTSITSKRPTFVVSDGMGGFLECLAFVVSSSSLTIIGNIQQHGTQITIDASSDNIGIGPDC
ncbi:Protein ASPARTIC PROTEASE IN GUARD CELL 2 [Striga hermonthica]|uniref:Protein ASPARTIC PROTEASE IN GUARD CELL 2 n=1 Tax=Striga hermonthica TaxID=68872 RepID=A0A9N7MZS0_STRHE|nr:Protein ASPARTIC PROTEASE IN GUARD CELL 2 [Striga hermonthica]